MRMVGTSKESYPGGDLYLLMLHGGIVYPSERDPT